MNKFIALLSIALGTVLISASVVKANETHEADRQGVTTLQSVERPLVQQIEVVEMNPYTVRAKKPATRLASVKKVARNAPECRLHSMAQGRVGEVVKICG